MTATQTQIRRDTATNLNAATPASGELGYDTTNKRLVVGDGSTLGGIRHASAADVQSQSFLYAAAGGSANAITITLSPAMTSYVTGNGICFKAASNNTGATTINVNGLGAKNIYKLSGGSLVALSAGDIVSGVIYYVTYDGTQYQLQTVETPAAPDVSGFTLLEIETGGGSSYDFTAISSTYKNYLFIIEGLKPATGAVDLYARYSTDGGSSYVSGTAYHYVNTRSSSSVTTQTITSGENSTLSIIADTSTSIATSSTINGRVLASDLNSTSNIKTLISEIVENNTTSPRLVRHNNALAFNTTSAVNGIRFLFDTGNITSGTIYMYGADSTL